MTLSFKSYRKKPSHVSLPCPTAGHYLVVTRGMALCLRLPSLPLSLQQQLVQRGFILSKGPGIVGGLLFNEFYFEKEWQGWVAILRVSFCSEPFRV